MRPALMVGWVLLREEMWWVGSKVYLGNLTVVVDRRSQVFAALGLRLLGPRPRMRMLWSRLRIVLFHGRFLW